jgi:hypothetical protein
LDTKKKKKNAGMEQSHYQGTGLSLAYDPNMILDATQLTQSTNNAPG